MAIRMQQRRGTSEQWDLANPVLGEGEIGWESDTNKFKIGDGVNNWDDLSYFVSVDDLEVNIDDFIPLTQKAANNGVATLDANGDVPLSQLGNVPATDLTGYATETYVNTAVSNLVDSAPGTLDTLNELAAALGDDNNFATTVTNAIANKQDIVSGVSSTEIGYLDGVTSAIQTQLNAKTDITQPILARTSGYTLTAAEKSDLVTCNGTFTITVPGNVFVAGDRVDFINIGTGTITFSGSSLTLNAADAKFTVNKQWAGATVFFTSATTAVLIGNLA